MIRVRRLCGAWNDADLVRSCPACSRPVRGVPGFLRPDGMNEMEREARRMTLDPMAVLDAIFGTAAPLRRAA